MFTTVQEGDKIYEKLMMKIQIWDSSGMISN